MGFKDGFQRWVSKAWVSNSKKMGFKGISFEMSFAFIFTEFVYKIKDIRQISLSDSFFFF